LRLSTFNAIFEGLLITDLFAMQGSHPAARDREGPWQTLLLEIAEDCARGRYPTAAQFGSQLRQIELQSTAGCLLAALPLLLVNIDRYGHRHGVLRQWARQMGLSASISTALDELFVGLCQIQAGKGALPYLPRGRFLGGANIPSFSIPCLTTVYGLLAQSQWQFGLSLQFAQQHQWAQADMGLIALFVTLQGGLAAIPLALRQKLWNRFSDDYRGPSNPGGWSMVEQQRLMALSHELYGQWSGINPSAHLPKEIVHGSIAITI